MATIEEIIEKTGAAHKVFKTADVAAAAPDYTRQYISTVVTRLVREGRLVKEGSGRWSTYALPKYSQYLGHRIRKKLQLEDLKEHEILDDIMRASTLFKRMPENISSIFNYAFSEMLNNAIDHSRSESAEIDVIETATALRFIINDFGVGVFRNVMQQRGLASELEAIQDILKGKTTTAPQAHSGEGIFFTSKAADVFILESFGLRLRIDNLIDDVFIEETVYPKEGTKVTFEISLKSKRHLRSVFSKYQTDADEPAFDRTEVLIKLYTMGTIYASRSQARRVLQGLNKFKTVVFDFDRVPTIGQAFADEVFRIFKQRHPDAHISYINANEAVAFMIERAAKNLT